MIIYILQYVKSFLIISFTNILILFDKDRVFMTLIILQYYPIVIG